MANEGLTPNFIWVMFDDSKKEQSAIDLMYIPYNCQFLLVESNPIGFKMVELYNPTALATKKCSKIFGTWRKNGDIEILISDFYERRFDMNQTELGVVSDFYVRV